MPCGQAEDAEVMETVAGPFEEFPTELLHQTARHLDKSDLAALALTCKSLHQAIEIDLRVNFPRLDSRNVWRDQLDRSRLDFLAKLVKDCPDFMLCQYCQALHRRRSPRRVERFPWTVYTCIDKLGEGTPIALWLPGWAYGVEFHDSSMVMDRYLYGQAHGHPLSSLAISSSWKEIKPGRGLDALSRIMSRKHWYQKLDVNATIHQNQLCLQICQRAWFSPWQRDSIMARGLKRHNFWSCPHTQMHRSYKPGIPSISKLIAQGLQNLTHYATIRKVDVRSISTHIERCPACPSEMAVTIYDHRQHGIEIVVDVWHNFGPCRYLDEPAWSLIRARPWLAFPHQKEELWYSASIWHDSLPISEPPSSIFAGMTLSNSASRHESASLVNARWQALPVNKREGDDRMLNAEPREALTDMFGRLLYIGIG